MGSTTGFLGLQKLQANDAFALNDYAFSNKNVDVIDRMLGKLESAVFTTDEPLEDPDEPLSLTIVNTGGLIPAGRTVRYKYTWVDAFGNESAGSPESVISTPDPVARPGQPGLTSATTGGTLLAGGYFYIVSAYVDVNTAETSGSPAASINIASGSTNKITITLPSLPSGATGFNIFRRGPGEVQFFYLDSVDLDVATPPSTYEDDNSVTVSNSRTPSAVNVTNARNLIEVSLPGATPSVPEGYTWKLYRTFVSADYNSSLLEWVVTESDGAVVPYTVDSGLVTSIGIPPAVSSLTGNVNRIAEVEDDVAAISEILGTNPQNGYDDVAAVVAVLLENSYTQEQIEDFVAAMLVDSPHVNASVAYSDEATPSGMLVITVDGGFNQEEIEDIVAAMFVDSTHVNATVTYSDEATPSGHLIIEASAAGYTQEEIEDIVAAMFVDSAHVNATVTYEDAATPSGRLVVDVTGGDSWAAIGLEVTSATNPWSADYTLIQTAGDPEESQVVIAATDTYVELFGGLGPNSQSYVDAYANRSVGVSAGSTLEAYSASDDFSYDADVYIRAIANDGSDSAAWVDITTNGPTSSSRVRLEAGDGTQGANIEVQAGHVQTEPIVTLRDAPLATPFSADNISFRILADGSLVLRSQDDGSLWKLLVSSTGVITTTSYTP